MFRISKEFLHHLGLIAMFFVVSYVIQVVTVSEVQGVSILKGIAQTWQSEVCQLFVFLFLRSAALGSKEEDCRQKARKYEEMTK